MSEKWLPIPSLPEFEASDRGRIRRGIKRILTPKVHKAPRGEYLRVEIWQGGKRKNRRVNRLVCEAFNGPPPEGAHARHIDGDSFNNHAHNLSWATPSQNFADQTRHGRANLPANIEELPEWADNWHKKDPTNLRQLKFINKLKMLERKARGRVERP